MISPQPPAADKPPIDFGPPRFAAASFSSSSDCLPFFRILRRRCPCHAAVAMPPGYSQPGFSAAAAITGRFAAPPYMPFSPFSRFLTPLRYFSPLAASASPPTSQSPPPPRLSITPHAASFRFSPPRLCRAFAPPRHALIFATPRPSRAQLPRHTPPPFSLSPPFSDADTPSPIFGPARYAAPPPAAADARRIFAQLLISPAAAMPPPEIFAAADCRRFSISSPAAAAFRRCRCR